MDKDGKGTALEAKDYLDRHTIRRGYPTGESRRRPCGALTVSCLPEPRRVDLS